MDKLWHNDGDEPTDVRAEKAKVAHGPLTLRAILAGIHLRVNYAQEGCTDSKPRKVVDPGALLGSHVVEVPIHLGKLAVSNAGVNSTG